MNAIDYYNLGVIHVQNGKYSKALTSFNKSLSLNPPNPINSYAAFNIGSIFGVIGNYDEALKYINKAIETNPFDFDFLFRKCQILRMLSDFENAIKCYDSIITTFRDLSHSDIAAVWTNKGCTLVNLKRYDEALECQNKAIKYDPSHYLGWYNKSEALLLLGRYEEALTCIIQALHINSSDRDCWAIKHNILLNLDRGEEAKVCRSMWESLL